MMKKFFLSAATMLFLTLSMSANAQKIAVIDVNQVLASLPDYKKAQEDLDKIAQKWRGEIAQQQDAIKGMYNRYQAEQVLLSDDQRKKKEEEIMAKEKEAREAQRVKFGAEGELFRKRQELVKPIQDKVYAAIEKFANEKGYDLVLDKGSSAGLIFVNATYDKTQSIIDMVKKM
jgi:outer membrane protein